MHSAPSVSFPVGRSLFQTGLCAAMAALAGAVIVLAWPRLSEVWAGTALSAWAVWCAFAVRSLRRSPRGRLVFAASRARGPGGTQAWAWIDAHPGAAERPIDAPTVVLDLQRRALLRLRPAPGAPVWVWVEAARAPQDWLGLRRALKTPYPRSPVADDRSGIVPRA